MPASTEEQYFHCDVRKIDGGAPAGLPQASRPWDATLLCVCLGAQVVASFGSERALLMKPVALPEFKKFMSTHFDVRGGTVLRARARSSSVFTRAHLRRH